MFHSRVTLLTFTNGFFSVTNGLFRCQCQQNGPKGVILSSDLCLMMWTDQEHGSTFCPDIEMVYRVANPMSRTIPPKKIHLFLYGFYKLSSHGPCWWHWASVRLTTDDLRLCSKDQDLLKNHPPDDLSNEQRWFNLVRPNFLCIAPQLFNSPLTWKLAQSFSEQRETRDFFYGGSVDKNMFGSVLSCLFVKTPVFRRLMNHMSFRKWTFGEISLF